MVEIYLISGFLGSRKTTLLRNWLEEHLRLMPSSVSAELRWTLMRLIETERPEVILIESTGVANPLDIIDVITDIESMSIN